MFILFLLSKEKVNIIQFVITIFTSSPIIELLLKDVRVIDKYSSDKDANDNLDKDEIVFLFVNCFDMYFTKRLLGRYDELLSMIEQEIKKLGTPVDVVILYACKDVTMSQEFKEDLARATDITNAFDWIRVYSTWYQSNLLTHLSDVLLEKAVDIPVRVKAYVEELQTYFTYRVKQLPTVKHEEMLLVRTDDAWDSEALQGSDCTTTCKQIAAVLKKEGRVSGSLHKPYLYIRISS